MTSDQLRALKAEFRASYDRKKAKFHPYWQAIMKEYKMDSFDYIYQAVVKHVANPDIEALDASGRVPFMNVLVRKFAALLNMSNPEFLVEELKPNDEAFAWVLEQVSEHITRWTKLSRTGKRVVLEAGMTGLGAVKVGYDSAYFYGETPWTDSVPREPADLKDEDKFPYGPVTEYADETVSVGKPNAIFIPTRAIVFDPGARVHSEIRRIYTIYERPLIDVYRDDRMIRSVRKQLRGFIPESTDEALYTSADFEQQRHFRKARVIECFDIGSQKYCVFANEDGVDRPLRDWTEFPLTLQGRHPYHFFTPIEDPEGVWGIPFAFLFLPQCQAANYIRALIMQKIASDSKKLHFFSRRVFSEDLLSRAQNAGDNAMIMVDNDVGEDLRQHMVTVEFSGANADIINLGNRVQDDMNFATGLTSATRGDANPGGDQTATEVHVRQQQQTISTDDMREDYEEFLQDIMTDLFLITLKKWPQERLVKVVGSDPRVFFWIPIERERILRDFNLRIVAGSTEKIDKATRRRQWTEMLDRVIQIGERIEMEELKQLQGQPPSPINWVEVAKETFDQFDPSLSRKILRRRDAADILERLISQHGMMPVQVSQELAQQLQLRERQRQQALSAFSGQPALPSPQTPPEPRRQGGTLQNQVWLPNPGTIQQGRFPDQSAAGVSGRMLSEAMGAQ